jgi:hypothetical protein
MAKKNVEKKNGLFFVNFVYFAGEFCHFLFTNFRKTNIFRRKIWDQKVNKFCSKKNINKIQTKKIHSLFCLTFCDNLEEKKKFSGMAI